MDENWWAEMTMSEVEGGGWGEESTKAVAIRGRRRGERGGGCGGGGGMLGTCVRGKAELVGNGVGERGLKAAGLGACIGTRC